MLVNNYNYNYFYGTQLVFCHVHLQNLGGFLVALKHGPLATAVPIRTSSTDSTGGSNGLYRDTFWSLRSNTAYLRERTTHKNQAQRTTKKPRTKACYEAHRAEARTAREPRARTRRTPNGTPTSNGTPTELCLAEVPLTRLTETRCHKKERAAGRKGLCC